MRDAIRHILLSKPRAWVLTIQTTAAGQAYSLAINSGTNLKVRIDWGDGVIEKFFTTGIKSHTYASAGTYKVRISGSMTAGNISQDSTDSYANAAKVKATSAIRGITGWANFKETFRSCVNLTSIPADLFRYNTEVAGEAFRDTFYLCTNLNSIPTDLFRYNTAVAWAGFDNTFRGCTSITSIPADLFRYNTFAGRFNGSFMGTSITSIPADLFRYNTAVAGGGFASTFQSCTNLTSIPADLFRYNTALSSTGFQNTFWGCTNLTSIPADLFRYNTAVSNYGFNATFQNCTNLTTIPTDLFRYNTALSSYGFYRTFWGCTNLTSIPADLFRYNTAVAEDGFYQTFYACNKLTMRADVFGDLSVITDRFKNRVSGFAGFFQLTGAFTGTQGIAPNLWSVDYGTQTPTKTNAFTGHAVGSLSNYASIPNEWKGL